MTTSSKLESILNQYSYELKKTTRTRKIIVIKSKDRNGTQKEIEKALLKNKFAFMRVKNNALSGSMEVTSIQFDKNNEIILVFKPISGGMNETTLNSTITELSPALAFEFGYKPKTVDDFYSFLKDVDHAKAKTYVIRRDAVAGLKFINDYPNSSKFKVKMENAIGILGWLEKENKKNPIDVVYWGYREKPKGVDNKHKGDLYVKYKKGNMLGVSLKAGDENSKEPKLNTYVKPILESIDPPMIDSLRKTLLETVYNSLGADNNMQYDKLLSLKAKIIKTAAELEKSDLKKYDELYDTNLNIIRNALTKSFEKDVKKTVNYLQSAVVGKGGDVPLLVLKAFGTNVKVLTDEDDVGVFLPKVKSIKSYSSTTSKQDFYIELIGQPNEKLKMKFSVRTNKVGDLHKLGQFFNLAVKFNGIV